MKKNTPIKGLTLLGFVLLLSLFILYRMDMLIPSPPVNDQLLLSNSLAADTIPPTLKDSLVRRLPDSDRQQKRFFSSSKSIVVMKERPSYLDSALRSRNKERVSKPPLMKREWMMSSSKSVVIVPPGPALRLIDSIASRERKYKTVKQ